MIGAAVDVGSNSVHLLVARRAGGGRLEHVYEKSEFLGLGDVVDQLGALPPDHVDELIAALRRLRDHAEDSGAQWLELVGTAPLRRARNSAVVAAEVESALGLRLRILSEHEEGELTFRGVLAGAEPAHNLLVIDIGGGSSEVVYYRPRSRLQVVSLPTGTSTLTARLVEHDPPTDADIARLRMAVAELVAGLPDFEAGEAIFGGGTATKLARLGGLDGAALKAVLELTGSTPAAVIANRYGLKLRRAQQLAAGAVLVTALLERYRPTSADASEGSLRDGMILARLG